MTIRLALDPISGHDIATTGVIAAISPTVAGLNALGFDSNAGYTGTRVVSIDETDSSVWNNDCEPGWYHHSSAVQIARPLTIAQQVAVDISNFQESVEREAIDWERVLAEESFSPHTDSGHKWSDDLLHSLLVPNIRGLVVLLENADSTPNAGNITAYRARLDSFIAIAETPGVLRIYNEADKAVWRQHRSGSFAYGYDVDTGGIRTFDHDGNPATAERQVAFSVQYPVGTTVATWDALAGVRAL